MLTAKNSCSISNSNTNQYLSKCSVNHIVSSFYSIFIYRVENQRYIPTCTCKNITIWWSKCYVRQLNWSRHIPCVDSIHQLFARISVNVNISKRILRINFLTCSILEGVINGSLATMSSSKISTSVLETNVHYEYGCHGMSCHYIILSLHDVKTLLPTVCVLQKHVKIFTDRLPMIRTFKKLVRIMHGVQSGFLFTLDMKHASLGCCMIAIQWVP